MEKNNKKLVFTIMYGVMFALTVIGVFQLLYNAVTMIVYDVTGSYFTKFQLPLALMIFVTAIFATIFVVFEIKSICTKKEEDKKKYFTINIVFMSLIVLTMIACKVVFHVNNPYVVEKFPHEIYSEWELEKLTIYQGAMTLLVTQFTYEVIISALRIAQRICAKKNKLVGVEENTVDNVIKE